MAMKPDKTTAARSTKSPSVAKQAKNLKSPSALRQADTWNAPRQPFGGGSNAEARRTVQTAIRAGRK